MMYEERMEYRAVGRYNGQERLLEVRTHRAQAFLDCASMTQADETWIMERRVLVGPWERTVTAPGVIP